jgi:hypothetical protein
LGLLGLLRDVHRHDAVADRHRQQRLQHGARLDDRRVAVAAGAHPCDPSLDVGDLQLRHATSRELRQDAQVQLDGVVLHRLGGQPGRGALPPVGGEVLDGGPAPIELERQFAGLAQLADLFVELGSELLVVERPRAVAAALAPAHDVLDAAGRQAALVDAHAARFRSRAACR